MNIFALVFLGFAILLVQAFGILFAALQALRVESHRRWKAYLDLQKLLLSQLESAGVLNGDELCFLRGTLNRETTLGDPGVLTAIQTMGREMVAGNWVSRLGKAAESQNIKSQPHVLWRRIVNARKAYEAAVKVYEARRSSRLALPVVRLLGFRSLAWGEGGRLDVGIDSDVGSRGERG
ncbi:MAG: hypothetical protein EBS01_08890 [Verrucomicrobia bacterium]|nr:hypothetical protein [Verrucomicrobiota bacterium]